MKRIGRTIFVIALVAVLSGLYSPKAKAQFIVNDPLSLAELVVQVFQDVQMFEDDWEKIEEKVKQAQQVGQKISSSIQAGQYAITSVNSLTNCKNMIMSTNLTLSDYMRFLNECGDAYSLRQADNIRMSYVRQTEDLLKELSNTLKKIPTYRDLKPLEVLEFINEAMDQVFDTVASLSTNVKMSVNRLAHYTTIDGMVTDNQKFLSISIM